MNVILLSGGSGKRLWPLSNDVRSKQFIKIFKTSDGKRESMVQRVHRQIMAVDPVATITIATSKSQVSMIHNQLGSEADICIEPCRRDTFPAILLATAYLIDIKGLSPDEPVVVCPIDPFVEEDYFSSLLFLSKQMSKSDANLILMGIKPTYPSEKYGYIIPDSKRSIARVLSFKEKPDIITAKACIGQGALWNGGVFVYKLRYVMDKAMQIIGYSDFKTLYNNYANLPKTSFDYAVVEKEPNIEVLRFDGRWKDIGTWNTLSEAMNEEIIGDGHMDSKSSNVHILNELDIPILAMGLRDIIISASPDGILVSDKYESSFIKPYVDNIDQPIKYAEKSWGSFKIIDVEDESVTIKVTLNPGHRMDYHSHNRRDEVWTVISGQGKTIVDGMERLVKAGDIVMMAAGCRHTIIAETELKLIEVQLGKEIEVSDKRKFYIDLNNCI